VADASNGVHHVTWCVRPENYDRARAFWEKTVGQPLEDLDLPEIGLRVLVAWDAGVEVMTPFYDEGTLAETSRAFLEERGEGVFSVVYNVTDIEESVAKMTADGGQLIFRETIPPALVDDRQLVDASQPRFTIHQAGFEDICGMRICFQQIVPEPST
jgi:methylmalonyl-CoA/ethylmalonyl-CoA epimerase